MKPAPLDKFPVSKKLSPGQPGTKILQKRFGDRLVCVRYRLDETSGQRITTVELAVSRNETNPQPHVFVRIGFDETELRAKVKAAGGQWNTERKLWLLPPGKARSLGLGKRIVKGI